MTRTVRGDAVRFAPARAPRAERLRRQGRDGIGIKTGAILGSALLVGGLGLRGTGWLGAVAIAVPTAVITLIVLALLWWRLPHAVSLTISPSTVAWRRYGRRTTVRRGPGTSAVVALVSTNEGKIHARYILVGDGRRRVSLGTGLWSDDEYAEIVDLLGAEDLGPEPLTPKDIERLHPGTVHAWLLHPVRPALLILVVLLVVVLSVLAVIATVQNDDSAAGDGIEEPAMGGEALTRQEQALSGLRDVVAPNPSRPWLDSDPIFETCGDGSLHRQTLRSYLAEVAPLPGTAMAAGIDRIIDEAGLTSGSDELLDGSVIDLEVRGPDDGRTPSSITVTVFDESALVEVVSACA